jgi:hypothetical protein
MRKYYIRESILNRNVRVGVAGIVPGRRPGFWLEAGEGMCWNVPSIGLDGLEPCALSQGGLPDRFDSKSASV